MNKLKLALCMIVKGSDRESELLDRCLGGIKKSQLSDYHKNIDISKTDGLAKYVDGIFITITGDNDKCVEVAKKYNANISKFEWINDFSAARNFNFSQVPPEYDMIVWTDTDDIWENPQLIRNVVETAYQNHVDAIILKYKYDFDEYGNPIVEHLKTRIVRNDGCVKWVNQIHEDFQENREITSVLNKDINVLHLTDKERTANSALRNVEIAEKAVIENPKDPHSYWNLANSYLMSGQNHKAIEIYLQFLDLSNSDEERFLSWQRLAIAYKNIKDYARGIGCALEALSLRPWYPDPYFLLGQMYSDIGKHRNAIEMFEMGFTKDPLETEMIVWNPLDYTYNSRLLLGKAYLAINKPRDAIKNFRKCLKIRPKDTKIKDLIKSLSGEVKKFDFADNIYKKAKSLKSKEEIIKLLESVPEDMKFYPPLVSLRNRYIVKTESSGKDVVIYCGFTVHEWYPGTAITDGFGGSEEAIVQLAKRIKNNGYNVTVYCNTPRQQEYVVDGVFWKPFMGWNCGDKQDITIIWRAPRYLDFDINSDKIFVDIHDVVPPAEFTPSRLKKVTGVLFKSKVQRDYYTNIPDDKAIVIPHGLDIDEFDKKRNTVVKNPYLILNTSSPDRGIRTSIKAVKLAYNKLSDELKSKLKFAHYYGFNVWDVEFSNDNDMMKWKSDAINEMQELKDMGIMTEDSGIKLSQDKITDKYLEAGLLLYPSNFFEIGFISGMKAMLAGCIPLTTDVFAQGEFCKGIKIHSDVNYTNWDRNIREGVDYGVENVEEVADKIVEYITNVNKYELMRKELIEYAKSFTWEKTCEKWIEVFNK